MKPLSFLQLLFTLFKIKQTHRQEKRFYQQAIQVFPNLKYPPLESCKDYKESLQFKYHLSYLLGEVLIQADKDLFKGGYLKLLQDIKKAKEIYKSHQAYKEKLQELNLSYCFMEKNHLLEFLSFFKEIEILINKLKSQDTDSLKIESFFSNLIPQIPFSTQTLFLLKHKEEILEWLNSKEFKEQYINTNHPYPPLLNPRRLNARIESQLKTSIVSTLDGKRIDCHESQRFSRNDESSNLSLRGANAMSNEAIHHQAKNNSNNGIFKEVQDYGLPQPLMSNDAMEDAESQDIQPYPNLSYENIPAELAWKLNLPLPRRYKFILWHLGSSASVAFPVFLRECGITPIICWQKEYNHYVRAYDILKQAKDDSFCIKLVNCEDKFLSLMDKKVPLVFISRDPIEKLQHAINHLHNGAVNQIISQEGLKLFNLTQSFVSLMPKVQYSYNQCQDYPSLSCCYNENFNIHSWSEMDRLLQFISLHKEKIPFLHCIDFLNLKGAQAFDTMCDFALKFGLEMPSNKRVFEDRINRNRGSLYQLPVTLYAHASDLGKQEEDKESLKLPNGIKIFIGSFVHFKAQKDVLDITQEILQEKTIIDESEIFVYLKQEDYPELKANEKLFVAAKEYIVGYVEFCKQNAKEIQSRLIREEDILKMLRENRDLALRFKKHFSQEIVFIDKLNPKIRERWARFKEFEQIISGFLGVEVENLWIEENQ